VRDGLLRLVSKPGRVAAHPRRFVSVVGLKEVVGAERGCPGGNPRQAVWKSLRREDRRVAPVARGHRQHRLPAHDRAEHNAQST
jgi:hypothetical protein